MNIIPYLGILLLILISAFFSASEIAYTSVNRVRLKKAAQSGNKRAQLAHKILERYDSMLYTILIGNNLVNIGASSLATVIAISLLGDAGAGVASLVMTVLILLFGEILPKSYAREKADSFVQQVAYPLRGIMWVLRPVVKGIEWLIGKLSRIWRKDGEALPTVTEEEFAAILETVEDEGVLDEDRSELLHSALAFDDITVQEILTPRMLLYAIEVQDSDEKVLERVLESRYSRLPVYEDTVDHIVGVLYVNTYLKERARTGHASVRELMREPQCIHKTMKLDDALTLLRQKHVHVAVVMDEFGGTLGIVTMEDILEELVGDIWDESDEPMEPIVRIDEDTFACAGWLPLHEFFDEMDLEDEHFDSEYTTLGGWATEMLDAMPAVGDSFTYKHLTLTVLEVEGARVERLSVDVGPVPQES